jgi:hypothetical protein
MNALNTQIAMAQRAAEVPTRPVFSEHHNVSTPNFREVPGSLNVANHHILCVWHVPPAEGR